MSDLELLLQLRATGSEQVFRMLFDRHYDRLFRIALYFLQHEDWAQEVALDVLATIWQKRQTMIVPEDFRHFTFVMVRNAAINRLKSEAVAEVQVSLDEATGVDASSTSSPEQLLEESELFEVYERLVSELPERCRQVFMLVKEDGYSYAEVAEHLRISVKTVDAQLQKALGYLREHLAQYLDRPSGRRFFTLFL